jgi:hypothetical protein
MTLLLLACNTPAALDSVEAAPVGVTAQATTAADCKTSCSLGDQAEDMHLTAGELQVLLEDWNTQVPGDPTIELETLLFYFQDTQHYLDEHGDVGLDLQHAEFLRRELARDTVIMEMRLVDAEGTIRGRIPPTEIPLKTKQHITFEGTGSLKHLETGGKVKRVGLAHLWSRW